jgi:nucleotide-binding universal stress UspA family protein
MKAYLVVLDGTPISWEAAYSAFHLAARLGSRLIGLAAQTPDGEPAANQWLAEFETGARVAGIAVESRLVVGLDAETLAAQAAAVDGVFCGHPSAASQVLLGDALDSMKCSLWLVPSQTSVRRIVHLSGEAASGNPVAHFAGLLSRRLGAELTVLPLSEIEPAEGRPLTERILTSLSDINPDLLILGRSDGVLPWRALCQAPPCLTVCLPP